MAAPAEHLEAALPHITATLDAAPWPVFRRIDLSRMLRAHRSDWALPPEVTTPRLVAFLLEHADLEVVRVELPRPETLHAWRSPGDLTVASCLKPGGYLCHFSAMEVHDLTAQMPRTIYVNNEGSPIPSPPGELDQASVDRAFRGAQRTTKNQAPFRGRTICVLTGKYTGGLGVDELEILGGSVRVTNLERTLVDIAVRPAYAGGVAQVLEAFERAIPELKIPLLSQYLNRIGFKYPYHQVVGFYLEAAGAPESTLEIFDRAAPRAIDFYLDYAMREMAYSSRWRLFVPASFKGLQGVD